jgi:hypothetical protein
MMIRVVSIAILILFTMTLRLPIVHNLPVFDYINYGIIYAFIYLGLFVLWGVSINRRIIQKQTLKFLMTIMALMVF